MSREGYSEADLVQVIQRVQNLIEWCIQCYMNKSECKHVLHSRHKIDRVITETVWHRLEKDNEGFFGDYYVRLVLIEQIKKYNMLLERHVRCLQRIEQSGVPAPMHTYDPSPVLNNHIKEDVSGQIPSLTRGQQEPPSAPAWQNLPLKAEEMQKPRVVHNFGSSIQQSPQGFLHAPICHNNEMYSVVVADVVSDAPQSTEPLRAVNTQQLPMPHEFESPFLSPTAPTMGGVSYPPPQCPISYGAGPSNLGYFQENVYVPDYYPNFRDATMAQNAWNVITAEAGNCSELDFDPSTYCNLVDLSPTTGDTCITSLSSDASEPTKLNEVFLEEILLSCFKTPSPPGKDGTSGNGGQGPGEQKYGKGFL